MASTSKSTAAGPKRSSSGSVKRSRASISPTNESKPNKRSAAAGKGDGSAAPVKANKGLRHFSMKVCKKVEEKGQTTYNEVADELVKEFIAQRASETLQNSTPHTSAPSPTDSAAVSHPKKNGKGAKQDEEKNIRRRVYDALNVLMAMDIISKEKKDIRWKGLPANHDLEMLMREKEHRAKEMERKKECLQELLVQQVCFRNLVRRNRERDIREAAMSATGGDAIQHDDPSRQKISMPFIVVNTASSSVIQCEMNPERTQVNFDFSLPFEVNDDNEILKRLGLNKTTYEELRLMLPPELMSYCLEHRLLDNIIEDKNHLPNMMHPGANNYAIQQQQHNPYPHYSNGIMEPPRHHHHSQHQDHNQQQQQQHHHNQHQDHNQLQQHHQYNQHQDHNRHNQQQHHHLNQNKDHNHHNQQHHHGQLQSSPADHLQFTSI
eukprot:CAMPEP_0172501036 /NCGR_PEP_ID=MMETSP1066-20121228/145304_1 /TAXON_ID=671091 /ORGANISM="Coscinodiscus wailesii, Strain CCMP2513" /LENGTH=434 /DNA_ID=CAMNT_0013275599 /DNA_START=84 /DNA_END=1388 /DNA_ORIENTATION=+